MASKDSHPWDIQPTETDNAFAAFRCYLELGATRSIRKAGEVFAKKESGAKVARKEASGKVSGWATKYHWTSRARAYDDHMARETTKAVVKGTADRLTQFNDGAFGAALLIFNKVVNSIRNFKGDVPPALWAQLLSVADKLARLALGAATENVSTNLQVTLDVLRSKEVTDVMSDPENYAALERIAENVAHARAAAN